MNPTESPIAYPEVSPIPEPFAIPKPVVQRQRIWLHVLLFLLTIGSTVLAAGPMFSAGLLSILLAHEFGHYFAARKHRVAASLPYFIPFPFSLFGTFGAVIRMSPYIPNRRALFDIAAAGPLAGLVLAIPISYFGIAQSQIVPNQSMGPGSFHLGEPYLFQGLTWLAHGTLGANADLMLGPLAFAGWAGMLVTALNLLPIGQLDGGHLGHALVGSNSALLAKTMFFGLALFCIVKQNPTWVLLLIFLLLFGIKHPRTLNDELPLDGGRRALGILLGIVFLVCFTFVPIRL